ncbi:epoxide hydrolase family protein [Ensifer sp. Root127]|uniref:epoxide hydrolase family protein n=1 Tax=Ensifer sp. Root127 TaxID=1736440 RepID=UPI00070EE224|nr:epoxide hydrolase family protein [Ensifer sp. Root127]KQW72443.1 multidrug MFS transporter [Ensifer sp. Root127]
MTAFKINIPQSDIDDLNRRLSGVRWPAAPTEDPWILGTDQAFLERLLNYWSSSYSWREQEKWLNSFPQFKCAINGHDVHFVHVKGEGTNAKPLLLTHGWPGSFIEFLRAVPYLTTPSKFGGDPRDAFDVIIPSLPGFGFSACPTVTGVGPKYVASLWKQLMDSLGYERFFVQGGDLGASVSTWMSFLYPDSILAMHLNFIPGTYRPFLGSAADPISPQEDNFLKVVADWASREGAYGALHKTKPETLAFALSDSPVGLASWISEKFHAWSDCGGNIEQSFSLDDLITNISIYWFTNTIASSMRIYVEGARVPLNFAEGDRVDVCTGVSVFPKEIPMPPRSWVERVYRVEYWKMMDRGGHFAAMEHPKLFAEEMKSFFGR